VKLPAHREGLGAEDQAIGSKLNNGLLKLKRLHAHEEVELIVSLFNLGTNE